MVNHFLRMLFYWPIRLTATCNPIPFEPLKHIKIDPNKDIVYIMVSSSVGNMLTVERLTKQLGWPSPFEKIKIGSKLLPRTAYLRSPSFFSSNAHVRDISDIIFDWFEACHENNDQDIQIIPISVLWSRDPSIEGSAIRGVDLSTPGWRKFLTLTFAGRDNCTIISDPTTSKLLEERLNTIADTKRRRKVLNRMISLHFLRKARALVGRPFPNRPKLLQELVKRHGTQVAIAEEIATKGGTQEELEKKASMDAFTRTLNKAAFESYGARRLAGLAPGEELALLILDMDDFKGVNDTYGHQVGDHVLVCLSGQMKALAPPRCQIGRMGGDEFAVLFDPPGAGQAAGDYAARLIDAVRAIEWEGRSLSVGCSIGIALGGAGASYEDLYAAADRALYAATRQGKDWWPWAAAAP